MIIAKYNGSSSTEICSISGHPFYVKEGLAFFLDGDTKKPVAPDVALQQGFTMDKELLCFLSSELRHLKRINLTKILGQ